MYDDTHLRIVPQTDLQSWRLAWWVIKVRNDSDHIAICSIVWGVSAVVQVKSDGQNAWGQQTMTAALRHPEL